ncbi:hypothetical protein FHX82_002472 [Amycolatopsis bartoniae]|uniref:UPF0235 protein GCM10017566_57230 n=1 Tax=Amycolatopsis bartoniae TaxID=941986 RepID=A0A8H9MFY6_9PSEU|nr:DUF167 domain-containing protein [Amycolatopsis bartoniae]MBB2935418.1 hypothetical protein [Amycolatopsis bartoniae]TVT03714.1 DUF167 domain-containing protein [Amycolatopsis bartoniae]GHF75941.1 UPF0235 protein [Amycolatopsis bartoniae]
MTRFAIRVKPGARRDFVGGDHAGALVVAVKAPAVEGKANEAVRRVLARELGLRSRDVLVAQGERGRDKVIELAVAPDGIEDVLAALRQR